MKSKLLKILAGIIFLLLIIAILMWVNKNYIKNVIVPRKTLQENFVSYQLPNNAEEIVMSPFGSENLWFIDGNGSAYEFQINSQKWRELDLLFGDMASGLRKNDFVKDEFDSRLVWIANFHKGIIKLNISTGEKQIYPSNKYFTNHAITLIYPDRNSIWIGTSNGLYQMERKTGSITEIKGFSDVWINSLIMEGDHLWINGEYAFYPLIAKIKHVSQMNYPFEKSSNIKNLEFTALLKLKAPKKV